jgi:uracil-DNA glycosylase
MNKKNFEQLIVGVQQMKAHMAGAVIPNVRVTEVIGQPAAHFNQGLYPIAFVFSVPGTHESSSKRPVTGDTGVNLCMALELLVEKKNEVFPSLCRYDYRITNAFATPTSIALGDRYTEASNKQVMQPENIQRVKNEVRGCSYIILCGGRAQKLRCHLQSEGVTLIEISHISNSGLNNPYSKHKAGTETVFDSSVRKRIRIRNWALALIQQIPTNTP